jgi:2-iminobutanoate/2-iminopropanoate deaminase
MGSQASHYVQLLNPSDMGPPSAAFSHGVVAGDMMFLAGQCGLDEQCNTVGAGDVAVQTRKAIENIEVVLRAGGFALTDVVHVTTFLVSLDDFDAYDRAYAQAFGSHRPARATVRADIHSRDLLVEIQAIAKKV